MWSGGPLTLEEYIRIHYLFSGIFKGLTQKVQLTLRILHTNKERMSACMHLNTFTH